MRGVSFDAPESEMHQTLKGAAMSWFDSYRAVFCAELKASAVELAEHGGPLLPGTYGKAGSWAGALDATPRADSEPAVLGGVVRATTDVDRVAEWWSVRPH